MIKNISIKGLNIWQVLLLTLIYSLLKVLLAFALIYITKGLTDDSFLQLELGEFLSALIVLTLFLFIYKKIIKSRENHFYNFPKLKLIVLLIIAVIGFRLLEDPFFHFEEIFLKKPPLDSSNAKTVNFSLPVLFKSISVIFLIPIFEELFFRKIIFKSLLKKYSNFWLAILVSSFLFSIIHLSLNNLIPSFLLGFITSYIYYKTYNIWYPISFHLLFNLLWFTIYINPKPYWILLENLNFGMGYWILIVFGIGLVSLAINQFRKLVFN